MIRVHIDAKPDHLLRLARRTDPLGAVAEMIWNSLDAEACQVEAEVQVNDIGGVERVIVRDDGHGMPAASCGPYFGDLGGSWKAAAKVSPNLHRTLHGRSGQGRLRGFALGQHVRWTTVDGSLTGGREKTIITADAGSPADFEINGPEATEEPASTIFDSRVPAEHADRLNAAQAVPRLTAEFALFLTLHPEVSIVYRGEALDPAHAQIHSADYALPRVEGTEGEPPSLRVIEWPADPGRLLALCDRNGVLLGTATVGIQAPGHHFTAYLLWDGLKDYLDDLVLAEWQESPVQPVIEAAREQLREHFRQRDEERRREQISRWKAEKVYPYESEPVSVAEAAERQVFDHVATTIARRLPAGQPGKKITLRLLRETLALDPEGLYPVLDELFHLTKTDREDLKRLLDRTSLASLIRAATEVTNRLDFLAALKMMVFDPEVSGKVRERSELHRILERELWVFGERYHLMVSDQSLNAVLRRHLQALGRNPAAGLEPVTREDGTAGIVDLMLGQASRGSRGREHLVIELKAPKVKIGHKEVGQVKSYAQAVASDPQFADADVEWDFWVISTEMDDVVRKDASQPNEPPGRIANWGSVRVWARTWAEITEDCETRLHFYRECLEHDPAAEHASEYLQRVHGRRTPSRSSAKGRSTAAFLKADAEAGAAPFRRAPGVQLGIGEFARCRGCLRPFKITAVERGQLLEAGLQPRELLSRLGGPEQRLGLEDLQDLHGNVLDLGAPLGDGVQEPVAAVRSRIVWAARRPGPLPVLQRVVLLWLERVTPDLDEQPADVVVGHRPHCPGQLASLQQPALLRAAVAAVPVVGACLVVGPPDPGQRPGEPVLLPAQPGGLRLPPGLDVRRPVLSLLWRGLPPQGDSRPAVRARPARCRFAPWQDPGGSSPHTGRDQPMWRTSRSVRPRPGPRPAAQDMRDSVGVPEPHRRSEGCGQSEDPGPGGQGSPRSRLARLHARAVGDYGSSVRTGGTDGDAVGVAICRYGLDRQGLAWRPVQERIRVDALQLVVEVAEVGA